MKIIHKIAFLSMVFLVLIGFSSFIQPEVKAEEYSKSPQIGLVMQIYDINPNTKSASVNIIMHVTDFPYNVSSLKAHIIGDVDTIIDCNQTGSTFTGTYYFQGQSNTSCFLEGPGQLFPFDSYSLRLELLDNLFYGVNCSISANESNAYFTGPQYYFMNSLWNIGDGQTFIDGNNRQELMFKINRSSDSFNTSTLELFLPIIASYYLLVSTLLLNPKKRLNERLTIYLALFVFIPAFLLSIQDYLPYRSSLSFPEFLLTNLVVSTTIFGIFSIIASRKSEHPFTLQKLKRKRVFVHTNDWDLLAVSFSLLLFIAIYLITLFKLIIPAPSLIISYLIIPAYFIWYPLENFKDMSKDNIVKTGKVFLLALTVTVASIFIYEGFTWGLFFPSLNFFLPISFVAGGLIAGITTAILLNRIVKSMLVVLASSILGTMLSGVLFGLFGIEGVTGALNGLVLLGIWGVVFISFELVGVIIGIFFIRKRKRIAVEDNQVVVPIHF